MAFPAEWAQCHRSESSSRCYRDYAALQCQAKHMLACRGQGKCYSNISFTLLPFNNSQREEYPPCAAWNKLVMIAQLVMARFKSWAEEKSLHFYSGLIELIGLIDQREPELQPFFGSLIITATVFFRDINSMNASFWASLNAIDRFSSREMQRVYGMLWCFSTDARRESF